MVEAIKKKVHLSYQRLLSNVAKFYPAILPAAEGDMKKRAYRKGVVLELSGGRKYEVQRDGSWKVLNKPRSRVKRLREERGAAARLREERAGRTVCRG